MLEFGHIIVQLGNLLFESGYESGLDIFCGTLVFAVMDLVYLPVDFVVELV